MLVRVYCARTQNIDQRLLDRSKKGLNAYIFSVVRAVAAVAFNPMPLLLLKLIFDKARWILNSKLAIEKVA